MPTETRTEASDGGNVFKNVQVFRDIYRERCMFTHLGESRPTMEPFLVAAKCFWILSPPPKETGPLYLTH
jgi:hypothetical protein